MFAYSAWNSLYSLICMYGCVHMAIICVCKVKYKMQKMHMYVLYSILYIIYNSTKFLTKTTKNAQVKMIFSFCCRIKSWTVQQKNLLVTNRMSHMPPTTPGQLSSHPSVALHCSCRICWQCRWQKCMTFVLEHTASHLSVLSLLALHLLAALMMAVHMSLLEHVSQVHQLPSVKQATVTANTKKT